jgi:hypothetical protein
VASLAALDSITPGKGGDLLFACHTRAEDAVGAG